MVRESVTPPTMPPFLERGGSAHPSMPPLIVRGGVAPHSHASPYGKGRWCEAPEGIRRSETERDGKDKKEAGRVATTAILRNGKRTDNPSVTLRMTAPFAQGSHNKNASPFCQRGGGAHPSMPPLFVKGEVVRSAGGDKPTTLTTNKQTIPQSRCA